MIFILIIFAALGIYGLTKKMPALQGGTQGGTQGKTATPPPQTVFAGNKTSSSPIIGPLDSPTNVLQMPTSQVQQAVDESIFAASKITPAPPNPSYDVQNV